MVNQLQSTQLRYQANPKQRQFHNDAYQLVYRLVSCGTGAGKTLSGCAEDVRWCTENDGIVGYVFEPTYRMVERILIPTLESDLLLGRPLETNPLIKHFSRSTQELEFTNGSVLWFGSLEDPERAEGPNLDFVHVDEARVVRKFGLAWQVITRRLRGSNSSVSYPRGAWVTTTPDTPGSSLYNFFENPKTKSPNSRVYRWSIFDNPKLPKEFVDEIVRTHTGGLAERFIYGRFAAAGTGTLLFDSTVNVGELATADIREVRYGVDFGWTNPTAIVAIAYDGDGRAWALDEVYLRHLSAEQIIVELSQLQGKYGRGEVLCDRSEPETIFKLAHAGFNAKGYTERREDGLRELAGRLLKQQDGKPRLFISRKCVNLMSELMEYDEKVKENDHAVDALRYSLKLKLAPSKVDAFRFG